MNKRTSQYIFRIGLLIMISLGLLPSCTFVQDILDQVPTSTPTPVTPTATLTATPRICPPTEGLQFDQQDSPPEPYLVLILFDPEIPPGGFASRIEYEDQSTTNDIFVFSAEIVRKSFQPGDRYSMFRLGCRVSDYANCARILNIGSPLLEASRPPPSPTLIPTNTAKPSPAPVSNPFALFGTQTAFAATQIQLEITATQIAFDNTCAIRDYEEVFSTLLAGWRVTQTQSAAGFMGEFDEDLEMYTSGRNARPTPFSQDVIFEGLVHASVVFSNECKNYVRCILIIFDDLEAWQRNSDGSFRIPDGMNITLVNVEVISVMLNCLDIYQQDCKELQENWDDVFDSLGAISPYIYTNGENLETFLLDILRR